MKTTLTVIALMSLIPLPLSAQTKGVDPQLRLLTHLQLSNTNGQGVAGWLVIPDLTLPKPSLLAVGGWLIKEERGWKEFMAGGLIGADGSIKPALNLRSYSKSKKIDLYYDLMWRPDKAIASSFATYPVGKFRLGIETELTASLQPEVKSSAIIGPRLSLKVPGADWLTISTSAMFDSKGDAIVRTYLLVNFSKTKR